MRPRPSAFFEPPAQSSSLQTTNSERSGRCQTKNVGKDEPCPATIDALIRRSNVCFNPFLRDLVASLRTVQLPGTPTTYANRAYLRELGLRWDPAGHRWHGTTTADRVRELRERLGLEVRVFGDLAAPSKGPAAPKPAIPRPVVAPNPTPIAVPTRDPTRRQHDGSRTRVEGRVAFPSLEEEDEIPTPARRLTV